MTKFDSEKFASSIKKKRGKMTFRECMYECGIDHAAIHKYEHKKIIPSALHLYRVCQWLEAPMNKFFTSK